MILINLWLGGTVENEIIMTIVAGALLICLKSLRNLVGPPFGIAVDTKEESFEYPTRFKTKIVSVNIVFCVVHSNQCWID